MAASAIDVADAEPLPELIGSWRERLPLAELEALDDDQRLAALTELELLSRSLSAVSVALQVDFYRSQVASQIQDGVAPSRAGKAVPDDLAAARRTSPYWGSRQLASSKALVVEMPRTLAALADGEIDLFQARLITEATSCLSTEDRAEVDERLAAQLAGASTAEIVARTRSLVYTVDPKGYVERARRAAKERGVSVRPCPDVMALISARLPAAQGVAVYKSLKTYADAMRASGDPRTRQQLMADEFYSRLTGRSVVDGVDVEVGLVITDAALFGGTSDAADLTGYGPVPAETARDLLRPQGGAPTTGSRAEEAPDGDTDAPSGQACPDGGRCTDFACTRTHGAVAAGAGTPSPARPPHGPTKAHEGHADPAAGKAARVWLRRLFTDPPTGRLVSQDARRRAFTGALRHLVIARDQTCRNAWCGAPIREVDHVQRFADGGRTDADNGRGLCRRCNLARERPRHADPPPSSYRPPPPVLPILLRAS